MVQPLELHEMNSLEFFHKLRMPVTNLKNGWPTLVSFTARCYAITVINRCMTKCTAETVSGFVNAKVADSDRRVKINPKKDSFRFASVFFHLHYFRTRFFPTRSQVESRLNQSCTFRIYGLIALAHWSRQNLKLK